MVDKRALKETIKDIPRVAKEEGKKWRKILKHELKPKKGSIADKASKVVKSEAFKDTVKDIPRVAKEQAEKVKKVFSKKDKPSTADKKSKARKYNPNKVIMAKEGGEIDKTKGRHRNYIIERRRLLKAEEDKKRDTKVEKHRKLSSKGIIDKQPPPPRPKKLHKPVATDPDAYKKKTRLKTKQYKEGGMIKKCKIDGIAKKGFTRAHSPKKGK